MHVEVCKEQDQGDAIRPQNPEEHRIEFTASGAQGKGCMNQYGHKLHLFKKRRKQLLHLC